LIKAAKTNDWPASWVTRPMWPSAATTWPPPTGYSVCPIPR